ncbi:MAG TPA: hypothetical protein VH593_28625 [Ktedonobacteraceae bacterium]|jgi:hypothetical protein
MQDGNQRCLPALDSCVLTRTLSWKGALFLFGIGRGIFVILGIVTLAIIFTIVAFIAPVSFSDVLSLGAILLSGMSLFWVVLGVIIVFLLYQRIEANDTGFTIQRGLARRHIAWNQVHLFAIDHKRDDKRKEITNWDELSGEHKVVRWEYDAEIPPRTLLQFTPPEYQQELEHLRSYIHAKTGLPLRDLRYI